MASSVLSGQVLAAATTATRSVGLEGTREEEVRFGPSSLFRDKIKVGYEYDFGASWQHEITPQKILPLTTPCHSP